MGKTIPIPGKNIIIFYCSSLRSLGLQSRVSLPNKTGKTCTGFVQVFDCDGAFVAEKELSPVEHASIDLVELEDLYVDCALPGERNFVFLFSLVPAPRSAQGVEEIPLDEIQRLNETQDFYIEHYIKESISAGVLYQASPVMNNKDIIPKFYFFMQAPKIFLSENQDTIFQFFHPNISREGQSGKLDYVIRNNDGTQLLSGSLAIPANGMRLLSVKSTLADHGITPPVANDGFLHFEACSDENIFISLTMQYNKVKETMDLEHTLSPHYYLAKNKMDKKAAFNHYQKA